MSTILSHSDLMQRAYLYLLDRRLEYPQKKFEELLDETSAHFNLSPLDSAGLERAVKQGIEQMCKEVQQY